MTKTLVICCIYWALNRDKGVPIYTPFLRVQTAPELEDVGIYIYTRFRIGHYKDPYEPISTMESHKGFERC